MLQQPLEEDLPMQALARFIAANSEESLTLSRLAMEANLSPWHLQRRFKAAIGLSPKAYLASCRLQKFKAELREESSVTDAVYEAGYGSSSRVYEGLDSRVGMTPGQYRKRGKGLEISYAVTDTPLGEMMLGATDRGICFIQFGASASALLELLRQEFPEASLLPMPSTHQDQFVLWSKALSSFLEGHAALPSLPLDIQGTAFQVKVWRYLQSIPPGKVNTYTEVATAIGQPKAARAVASACARNTIAIVIPCHRVIRGTGHLAGYRWGLERKQRLLELEKL